MKQVKGYLKKLLSNYGVYKLDYPLSFEERADDYNRHLYDIIEKNEANYLSLIDDILSFKEEITDLPSTCKKIGLDFSWDNGFFPGLDVAALYTMIAKFAPSQIIEVGSGYSTMISHAAAVARSPATNITSIDPAPRSHIDAISTQVYRSSLVDVDLAIFENLKSGDFVFIDGSHRLLPQSDVTHFFLTILPILPPGVQVQVHDVYLPYDYPLFMKERLYSEQYALAIALLYGGRSNYNVTFPCFYVAKQAHLANSLKDLWSLVKDESIEKHGGSFWFQVM